MQTKFERQRIQTSFNNKGTIKKLYRGRMKMAQNEPNVIKINGKHTPLKRPAFFFLEVRNLTIDIISPLLRQFMDLIALNFIFTCIRQIQEFITYTFQFSIQLQTLIISPIQQSTQLPMIQTSQQTSILYEQLLFRNPITKLIDILTTRIPLIAQLSNHFSSILLKSITPNWQKLLFIFGALTLTVKGTRLLKRMAILINLYIKHQANHAKISAKALKEKYGDGWVAITGFTQGIGWALVNELLRLQMKVVLIGRNKQKIDKRVSLLKQKFPQCQLQIVIGDLSKVSDIQNICKELKTLSQTIEIGILINNAGLAGAGQYFKCTPQSILDILQTNWTSVVLLNSTMIPIMQQRKHRSAIINFSSSTGRFMSPLLSSYPASKKMLNIYGGFLAQEHRNQIDVMTVMPFGVTTPMMRMIKSFATITPENCAKSVIGDLIGGNLYTHGGLRHKIFANMYENMTEEEGAKQFEAFWKKHV